MTGTTDPRDPSTVLLVDLDGTISDSYPGIAASFRQAMAEIGAPPPSPELLETIVGPPMVDTMASLGLPPEQTAAAMAAYRAAYDDHGWSDNSVYPGMAELLGKLADAGRTLAVATSKNQRAARRILTHFGLDGHFAVIAGASEDGSRRAKADVIAHALAELERLGDGPLDTERVVMVGDRSHDVEGAARFGIPTILVEWGYALQGEAEAATWAVQSVDQLREVLGV